MDKYSVWVGGVEVSDYYLTNEQAQYLAKEYIKDGYRDVSISKEED